MNIEVDGTIIEELYDLGFAKLSEEDFDLPQNTYAILTDDYNKKSSVLAKCQKNSWHRIDESKLKFGKDAYQKFLLDTFFDPSILVNVAIGGAGTGKTTLALYYAMEAGKNLHRKIYLTKAATFIGEGKAFGPVPGDINEKFAPYLDSFNIVLEKVYGKNSKNYLEMMLDKGDLKFIPLAFARGSTYDNTTFIIDEAQNLTWHELNSIISRVGENSKCIILGDPDQVDIRLPYEKTGLGKMLSSEVFQKSALTSEITLVKQYRSPITQLAIDINKEIVKKSEK